MVRSVSMGRSMYSKVAPATLDMCYTETLFWGIPWLNPVHGSGALSVEGRDPFPVESTEVMDMQVGMDFNTEIRKITDASIAQKEGDKDKTGWDLGDACESKTEPSHTYLVLKARDTDEKEI